MLLAERVRAAWSTRRTVGGTAFDTIIAGHRGERRTATLRHRMVPRVLVGWSGARLQRVPLQVMT